MSHFFVVLFFMMNNFAHAYLPIDGEWKLTERRCASDKTWSEVPKNQVLFDAQNNSYSVLTAVLPNCSVEVSGYLSIRNENKKWIMSLCAPQVEVSSSCPENIIEYRDKVNNTHKENICQDNLIAKMSADGQFLENYEIVNEEGLFCKKGEKLYYRYQRVSFSI